MDEARARFAGVVDGTVEVTRRESRWLALGDEIVAFAVDDEIAFRRLQREAWLLGRWRAAGVPAPRVLREDAIRRVQVRERMHGLTGQPIEPRLFRDPACSAQQRFDGAPLSPFGERLAASYGELARRIRGAVSVADAKAAGFGPCSRRVLDLDTALTRLHASGVSHAAKLAGERARTWLATLPPPDALIHSDLHFFNMCFADDGAIVGVFDLDDAGLDAHATELLYVHSLGSRFAATVIDAYGPIAVEDVHRAHLRTALDHIVRYGPGTERQASIVAWATAAFERLAP